MSDGKPSQTGNGWTTVAVIGCLLAFAVKCSSSSSAPPEPIEPTSLQEQAAAVPSPPAPPTIDVLAPSSVKLGGRHLRAAFEAQGLSGAMIYSQNCYDALSRSFRWSKLDQCGGFDMVAARSADGADPSLAAEIEYFASEAAAGRYLAAATKAGEEAGAADQRLEALQGASSALSAPKPAAASIPVPPAVDAIEPVEEEPDVGNLEAAADV